MTKPNDYWKNTHQNYYKATDWIDKPSIFAETAITYFPKIGRVLDLGAGQGQDSRFFAENGYTVVSTDLEDAALELSLSKAPDTLKKRLTIQKLDLTQPFGFEDESFDIVYAHLSLHYFSSKQTAAIFDEVYRVLKPGGILAFFVNSVDDPEFIAGKGIEPGYVQLEKIAKRFFSVDTAKSFAHKFSIQLADNKGETYKDAAKGIHNLIRFIGTKPKA